MSLAESGGPSEKADAELMKLLDEMHRGLWEDCSRNNRIGDVRDLANRLRELGTQYECHILSIYASRLFTAVDSFNLKKIREILGDFPRVLENLAPRSE